MQIISTYSSPDRSELNNHTGVTMHNAVNVNNIKVIHRGVQGWKRRYHFGWFTILCYEGPINSAIKSSI